MEKTIELWQSRGGKTVIRLFSDGYGLFGYGVLEGSRCIAGGSGMTEAYARSRMAEWVSPTWKRLEE